MKKRKYNAVLPESAEDVRALMRQLQKGDVGMNAQKELAEQADVPDVVALYDFLAERLMRLERGGPGPDEIPPEQQADV